MFLVNLLLSIIMLGFGASFLDKAPKKINPLFGYRTTMSMKNDDTWAFAHNFMGRIWCVAGLVALVVTIVAMLAARGMDGSAVKTVYVVLTVIQMVVLIGTMLPTEIALRKNFDKDGNRR